LKRIDEKIKNLSSELDSIKDNIQYEEKKKYQHQNLELKAVIESIDQCKDLLMKGDVFFKDLKELHDWISEVYNGLSKGISQYLKSDDSLVESKDDIDRLVSLADEKIEEVDEHIKECSKSIKYLRNKQIVSFSDDDSEPIIHEIRISPRSLHGPSGRKVKKSVDKKVERLDKEIKEKDDYASTDDEKKAKDRRLARKHDISDFERIIQRMDNFEKEIEQKLNQKINNAFEQIMDKLVDNTVSMIDKRFELIVNKFDLKNNESTSQEQKSKKNKNSNEDQSVKKDVKTGKIKPTESVNTENDKSEEPKPKIEPRNPRKDAPTVNIKQNLVENGTDNVVETEKKGKSSVGSNVKQNPKIDNVTQNLTVNIVFSDEELKEFKTKEVVDHRDLLIKRFLDNTFRQRPFNKGYHNTSIGGSTINYVISQLNNACEKLGPPKKDASGRFIHNEKYVAKDLIFFGPNNKEYKIKLTGEALFDLNKIIMKILVEPSCDLVRKEIKPAQDRKKPFSIEEAKSFCLENEKRIQAFVNFLNSNVDKTQLENLLISKVCKSRPGSMWRTIIKTNDKETGNVKQLAQVQCGIHRKANIDEEKLRRNGGTFCHLSEIRTVETELPYVILYNLWEEREKIKVGQHNWFIRTHQGAEQKGDNFINYLIWLGKKSKGTPETEWCFVIIPDDDGEVPDLIQEMKDCLDDKLDIRCFFDTTFRTWKQVERSS
jgi:hypothetical protein